MSMAPPETGRSRSFGTAAAEYDRLRSGAPASTVDWLTDHEIGSAVELGAGTGHFTRTLVGCVRELFAVEPDARMREVFRATVPGVTVLDGTAEEIPLDDNSVDAVFTKDAWHWFDPDSTPREIARVLRPGGRLGVLWNLRDESVPWMRHLFSVVDAQHEPRRMPGTFALPGDADFTPPEHQVVEWTRPMSPSDLVAMLGTYSAVLSMSETERAALYDSAHEYIDSHPQLSGRDIIDVPFRTVSWRTAHTPAGAIRQ
jgi:SAM-dependent methyltransferase